MAIQIQGNGGVVGEVDGTTFRTLRTTRWPVDYGALGFYRLAADTGTIGAAIAANGEIFQFRWTDATRLCAVYRVMVSSGLIVAATAAGQASLHCTVARSFTGAGTGGTALTLTGNNQKLRTSMGTMLLGEARIATTAALGAGTKTLDANPIGSYVTTLGTAAITAANRLSIHDRVGLLDADSEGQMPLILAQNEGFVVKNGPVAWPASATWAASITVVWAELTAY
jgi:hypothetical protein